MTCALSVLGCSPGQETPRRTTSSSASARLVAAGRGSRSPSGPLTGAAAPPVPRRAPRRPPRRAGPGSCSSSPGPRSCAGPGPAGAAARRVRGPSPAWSAAPRTGSPEPAPARSGRGRRGRPRLPRPARPHQRPRSRARPPPRRRRRNGPPARPCQRHRPGTERLRERLTRRSLPRASLRHPQHRGHMVDLRSRRRRAGGRDQPVDRGAPVRVRGPPLHDLTGHGDLDPLEGTPQPTDEAHRRRQPVITVTPRGLPQRLLRRGNRHRQPVEHRAPGILRGGTPGRTLPGGGLDRTLPGGGPDSTITGGGLDGCGSGRIDRVSRSAGLPRGEPCEELAEADTGRRRSRPRPWSDWLGVVALGLRLLLLDENNTRTGHRQPPDPPRNQSGCP